MQQAICRAKGPINATISLPGRAEITYRALLLAALANGVSEISGICINPHTRTLFATLSQLGIVTQCYEDEKTCIVAGCNGRIPRKQASVWCGSSLFIAEALCALCAETLGVYYLDAAPSVLKQTFTPIIDILVQQGVQFIPNDVEKLPFTLLGVDTLVGGECNWNIAKQGFFPCALLMIAPYARAPFTLALSHTNDGIGLQMSLTCALMAEFGVLVRHIRENHFMVPVPQRYQARDYTVEPDLSLALYFYAAAALTTGELTVKGVRRDLIKQNHSKFLSSLEKMGCSVYASKSGLTVKGGLELQGIEVNLHDFTDSFMALIAIAPFATSPTKISRIGHMHHQELKRLMHVKESLTQLGVRVLLGQNWIEIFPSKVNAGVVPTHGDYRIAFAFSLIGLKVSGMVIDDPECVNKVFPDFFQLLTKLAEQPKLLPSL